MTINPDIVRQRCGEIEESVVRLNEIARLSLEEFLRSQDAKDIACYRLLIAIEAALTLCYHVSARHLREVPEDYADCFTVLHQAGLLPEDLARRLQKMARFRNLLVHLYWKVDYRRVYDVLRDDLEDLRAFAASVTSLL